MAQKCQKCEFYDKFGTKDSILTKLIKTNKAELKMKDFTENSSADLQITKMCKFSVKPT